MHYLMWKNIISLDLNVVTDKEDIVDDNLRNDI